MHIRLLLISSFFLQFFPDLIRTAISSSSIRRSFAYGTRRNHLLLFGGREAAAIGELGASHEITRFKGLGEISAGEFKDFIGEISASSR